MSAINWQAIVKKKLLHEWPLSKVELVNLSGEDFILKTIHKDFKKEIDRQKLLSKFCKIRIPRIIATKKNTKISFLMELLPHKKEKIDDSIASKVIAMFHKDTKRLYHSSFKNYTFASFYKDYEKVKKYLPLQLKKPKPELNRFFQEVFQSQKSIVHGDWQKDQLFKSGSHWCIIDFGKSYRGPSILDHATYFLHNKDNKKISSNLRISLSTFMKAKLMVSIIILAWFELCKRKYINYDYAKEIKEQKTLLQTNLKYFTSKQ